MTRHILSRRDFLSSLSLFFIFSSAFGKSQNKDFSKKKSFLNRVIYITTQDKKHYINEYDFKSKKHIKIETKNKTHSVERLTEEIFLFIPKKGSTAYVVDLKKQKIIFEIKSNTLFYGHAVVDAKNKKFYMPEKNGEKHSIFEWQMGSYSRLQSIYDSNEEIHMLVKNKNDLLICIDSLKNPRLDVLNLDSKKVRSVVVPEKYFRPGHINRVSEDTYALAGVVGDGYDHAGFAITDLKSILPVEKDQFKKNKPSFWSSTIGNNIAVVFPYSNKIVFIDRLSKNIKKEIQVFEPSGVNIVLGHFVVTSSKGIDVFDGANFGAIDHFELPEINFQAEDYHPYFL